MDKYIIFVDVDGTLVKPRTNDMPRVVADEFERIKKDEEDARNWQLGIYFANSIMSTLMNSSLFRDLSSPQNKYPEKPLFSSYSNEDDLEEDSEANEILAAMEMDEYIKVLKQQNS